MMSSPFLVGPSPLVEVPEAVPLPLLWVEDTVEDELTVEEDCVKPPLVWAFGGEDDLICRDELNEADKAAASFSRSFSLCSVKLKNEGVG